VIVKEACTPAVAYCRPFPLPVDLVASVVSAAIDVAHRRTRRAEEQRRRDGRPRRVIPAQSAASDPQRRKLLHTKFVLYSGMYECGHNQQRVCGAVVDAAGRGLLRVCGACFVPCSPSLIPFNSSNLISGRFIYT
jgi:hypothetical protein